jgi:hypothetical protein
MAKTGSTVASSLKFGGRKNAATPRRRSVHDTNTKHMAAATWMPRHLRRKSS